MSIEIGDIKNTVSESFEPCTTFADLKDRIISDAPDHSKEAHYRAIFMRIEKRIQEGEFTETDLDDAMKGLNIAAAHLRLNNKYLTLLKRFVEILDGKSKGVEETDISFAIKLAPKLLYLR